MGRASRRRDAVVVILAVAVAVGCSGGDADDRASYELVRPDFMGELVAADTTGWEQTKSEPSDDQFAATSGGAESQLLVGPAVLTLDDGTVVTVAPGTRGGTFCPQLDLYRQPPDPPPGLSASQACLVIGMFQPGTTTAAWFATEIVDRTDGGAYLMSGGFRDGLAVVPAGFGSAAALPVAANVMVGCGLTISDVFDHGDDGYAVTLTPADEIVAIDCVGRN